MDHLALQVGGFNKIVIHNPNATHPSSSQIKKKWRPKSTSTNTQHRRSFETLLSFNAHLGERDVAGISGLLLSTELRSTPRFRHGESPGLLGRTAKESPP
jgi:hypothetical protein